MPLFTIASSEPAVPPAKTLHRSARQWIYVAGIAAASTDNTDGIAGTAFSSSLMPVKVLDSNGNGTYAGISSGIIWAADHGAEVINLSLSGAAYSKTLCDAVSYAISHGAVASLQWGPMTMGFKLPPTGLPPGIEVGRNVTFEFGKNKEGAFAIQSIAPTGSAAPSSPDKSAGRISAPTPNTTQSQGAKQ